MKHKILKIKTCKQVAPFTLTLVFNDEKEQTIDFLPVLKGQMYGPLSDAREFAKVKIDPEVHTIVWPNGADFDPETLYDWPKFSVLLAEKAAKWQ